MPELTVFISAKSEDYPDARRVFNFLTEQGIGCFFSDESLLEAGRADYKDAIDSALEQVLHLIVVTSSRANAESTWVKYEWNTFANELLADRKHGNLMTVACGGLGPAELPITLRQRQVLSVSELEKLPRFLPGSRPSTTKAPLLSADGDSPLQKVVARWLPAPWIEALRHRRRLFIGCWVAVTFGLEVAIYFGSSLMKALQAGGTPEFFAGLSGAVCALPAAFLYFAAIQWFVQLRIPRSRYWWLLMLLGYLFLAEVFRNGTYQLLLYKFTSGGGTVTFWWERLIAAGGMVASGLVSGTCSALYLKRYVRRPWMWLLYCVTAALPMNLILMSTTAALKGMGVSEAWSAMAGVVPALWFEWVIASALWRSTEHLVAESGEL